jgi:sugar lactone lactonase YvrE
VLVIGDTSAHYFAYPYDPATGAVGERRIFGDVGALDGGPDGSTVDGLDETLPVPFANPTDVTFGGRDLDALYVVSTDGPEELAGALVRIDGTGRTGRPEPRARLS